MVKLRSLEMLRVAAALLVVLFHVQVIFAARGGRIPFYNLFDAGSRGVDLFFVLSGFIIAYVHGGDLGRPARLSNYAFNRLSRVYPAVWVMTALAVLLYALGFGGADKAAKLLPGPMVASTLLLPQPGDALVNVTWTLTYEMFFYAMFAVAIVNRRVGLALLLAWQLATAVAAVSDVSLGPVGYYLRPICLEFGVGLGCAWFVRRSGRPGNPTPWRALLGAGVISFTAGMAIANARDWSGALCGLGAGAIILGLVRLEQGRPLRVPNLLVALGGSSYAIYLVHFSAVTVMAAVLARLHVPVTDALCLAVAAAAITAGVAFDHAVDRPIQRWLRQRKGELLGSTLAGSR